MILDDDFYQRSLLAGLIGESDFDVIEAEDSEEALAYLEHSADKVALLITSVDLSWPINGVELAHHVVERWDWVRVIVISKTQKKRLQHLPATATLLETPWRGLDVLREVARTHG